MGAADPLSLPYVHNMCGVHGDSWLYTWAVISGLSLSFSYSVHIVPALVTGRSSCWHLGLCVRCDRHPRLGLSDSFWGSWYLLTL